jgi:hypothetical protein
VAPAILCRQHLLGEHRELHSVWAIINDGHKGYARHPEVLRWHGRLCALYLRHEALVQEMARGGYRHRSPLDPGLATGDGVQTAFVDPPATQMRLLRAKGCECRTGG